MLLPPEETVKLFHVLVRERTAALQEAHSDARPDERFVADDVFEQSIDYDYFKKALIRLAALA